MRGTKSSVSEYSMYCMMTIAVVEPHLFLSFVYSILRKLVFFLHSQKEFFGMYRCGNLLYNCILTVHMRFP
jgi:hypothetical protein